ncbi:MAG: hypothetical protein QGH40_01815, partial [bacterium]|nr:hypothetical protein [bacterium]
YTANDNTIFAKIAGLRENATSGNYDAYLAFFTRTNGSSFVSERMRITSTGNVGIGTTSPASKLQVAGAIAVAVVTKFFSDSPYTATASDSVILVDASGGDVTIILPAANTCPGRMYTVKKIDSGTDSVLIQRSGTDFMEAAGTTDLEFPDQYRYFTVISNGVDGWHIISEGVGGVPAQT